MPKIEVFECDGCKKRFDNPQNGFNWLKIGDANMVSENTSPKHSFELCGKCCEYVRGYISVLSAKPA